MSIDLTAHLAAVQRKVVSVEADGKPAKSVIISKIVGNGVDDVWDALTSPDRLQRWFLPISGDLREGGSYQLEGNASGTITECRAPEQIKATWEFGGEVSWIEIDLRPVGTGTEVQLAHIATVDEVYWPTYGPGAAGVGWDGALLGLTVHLSDPELNLQDPGWMQQHARLIYGAASDAWGLAAEAAGVPASESHAQVLRTKAFYLGSGYPEQD